jgi:hypothetical protein
MKNPLEGNKEEQIKSLDDKMKVPPSIKIEILKQVINPSVHDIISFIPTLYKSYYLELFTSTNRTNKYEEIYNDLKILNQEYSR